jgi:hypothetical protein
MERIIDREGARVGRCVQVLKAVRPRACKWGRGCGSVDAGKGAAAIFKKRWRGALGGKQSFAARQKAAV